MGLKASALVGRSASGNALDAGERRRAGLAVEGGEADFEIVFVRV
jgi:hypothetical protein